MVEKPIPDLHNDEAPLPGRFYFTINLKLESEFPLSTLMKYSPESSFEVDK